MQKNRSVSFRDRIKGIYLKVFHKNLPYQTIVVLGTLLLVLINYVVLLQTTTWEVFWYSNVLIYNLLQIFLTVLLSFFGGVAIAMVIYIFDERIKAHESSLLSEVVALVFSLGATGCTVCGAILLPLLGIAASLTALPLGGLEIKVLSLALLLYSLYDLSSHVLGLCKITKEKLIRFEQGAIELNINRETLASLKPFVAVLLFLVAVYSLPTIGKYYRIDFRRTASNSVALSRGVVTGSKESKAEVDSQSILEQINPKEGYEINATYGDLGPRMLEIGVIDLEKFKQVYERSGQPLTKEQLQILTQGSDKKIRITKDNAYFLLNFFWAVGLANQTKILTEGEITKYGQDQLGYFASTGGWTLAKGNAMNYYAKYRLIPLTEDQEKLVERVASNIYRPCCNNPTSFPDCNHGMALLAVLELMAANGASEDEMYEAAKYFNAFWFPQSYYDLAAYFKLKEGKDYSEVDARRVLSKEFSSVSGWQRIKNQVRELLGEPAPSLQGGGCGV